MIFFRKQQKTTESSKSDLDIISSTTIFDEKWYRNEYADVADSNAAEHFLFVGAPSGYNPGPHFETSYYLDANADVAKSGINPLVHYLKYGDKEGRWPNWFFEPHWYQDHYLGSRKSDINALEHYISCGWSRGVSPSKLLSNDWYIAQGGQPTDQLRTPLAHYSHLGCILGFSRHGDVMRDPRYSLERAQLVSQRLISGPITPAIRTALSRQREQIITLTKNSFVNIKSIEVSIIVPVFGQTQYALACILSLLLHKSKYKFEIILADDCSPEDTCTDLLNKIPGVQYLRTPENLGFLRTCNWTVRQAKGDYIVLLNSDTLVIDGWLDGLIDTFAERSKAAIVGSQLVNADLTLQEAGGVFFGNGEAHNYGRGGDPFDPKYSFMRRCDYVSGASIAVRRRVWTELGGFDELFVPAYCEDADLSFRAREAGYEVIFQPVSKIIHYEGKTHGTDIKQGVKAYQVRNLQKFKSRWRHVFAEYGLEHSRIDLEANREKRPSILFIDALTPRPDHDSGSFMTKQIISTYITLGFKVYFVPFSNFLDVKDYTAGLQRLGVHCLYAPYYTTPDSLREIVEKVDYVFTFRVDVSICLVDKSREWNKFARIIYHTVDLHHVREARDAELKNCRTSLMKAELTRRNEMVLAKTADCTIVHTDVERKILLKSLDDENAPIITFPYISEVRTVLANTLNPVDIGFLGGFDHSPNVDAVEYLSDEIWPELMRRTPRNVKLLIAGSNPTAKVLGIKLDRLSVLGHVKSLEDFFVRCRVFIAPLRVGAGIKGKVIQALSHGVPSVISPVAAEGMGLEHGKNVFIAETVEDYSRYCSLLIAQDDVWRSMRQNGLDFIRENYSPDKGSDICRRVLDVADQRWIERFRANVVLELDKIQ